MESIQCILDGIELCADASMTPFENTSAPNKYLWVGNILDMTVTYIMRSLTPADTHAIKLAYRKMKGRIVRAFPSYVPEAFEKALGRLGLSRGDAVMMHVSFDSFAGFRGGPKDVIDCVLNVVGREVHLFMMSLAYSGSSYDYISAGKPFDVARTMSRMGIVSEAFLRRKHVLRSANSLHPVLAWGPQATE